MRILLTAPEPQSTSRVAVLAHAGPRRSRVCAALGADAAAVGLALGLAAAVGSA